MALSPGARLGPYEILSAIGAGGMGEVYRARDTRLDRVVAIKVLPASLASDPQFRERFDREARTISQLDHPHICTLYDVGDQDGTAFLVMQYLEGETLEHRLKKGALPLDQALQLAIQIADALDKAHRAGIVHRDLKPGNIMLTRSGAKLVDFGLAKARASVGVAPGLSMLPTTPPNLTAQGTLLGTFQYMAPEQLEGQEADVRTDIFAFGAVVYEMMTGKKAFEGKSQASLISSIMAAQPPAVSSIQKLTPPALDQLIARCLAKDPDDRWQSARDVKLQLAWIAGWPANAQLTAATGPSSKRSWFAWMAATAAVVVVLAAGLVILRSTRGNDNPPSTRFAIPMGPVGPVGGVGAQLAVSPDGRRVAFVALDAAANPQVFIRSFDAIDAQPLAGTEGAIGVFWSPDGRRLGFATSGKLKTIDVAAGGAPQVLCDIGGIGFAGGTWNTEGIILFGSAPGPIRRVSASGGEPEAVTTLDETRGEVAHLWPSFLPDGRHFLFMGGTTSAQSRAIYAGSLDSKDRVEVVRASSNAVYAEPGYLLFQRNGTLMTQPFDVKRLAVSGEPTRVADGVALNQANGGAAFSAAGGGVLAYRLGNASVTTQLTWHDRSGKVLGSIGAPGVYRGIALSPDDTRVAVHLHQEPDGGDIWVLDQERGTSTRFTFTQSHNIAPMWSSDGRFIVFASDHEGKGVFNLYQKSASGAGNDELIQKAPKTQFPEDAARDGQAMLYGELDTKGIVDIWSLPLSGERKPIAVIKTDAVEMFSKFSPDGRWLAYTSNESGRLEIYVQPYPQKTGKWQISVQGGGYPRWAHGGKELFYLTDDGTIMAVAVQPDNGAFKAGTPRQLFKSNAIFGDHTGSAQNIPYDVSSDDQRFLINERLAPAGGSAPITIVLNWTATLKQ